MPSTFLYYSDKIRFDRYSVTVSVLVRKQLAKSAG